MISPQLSRIHSSPLESERDVKNRVAGAVQYKQLAGFANAGVILVVQVPHNKTKDSSRENILNLIKACFHNIWNIVRNCI